MPKRIMHRDGTKFCRMCQQWVALNLFGKDKRRWDGLRFYCQACNNAAASTYRTNMSPDALTRYWARRRIYSRESYARIKADPVARSGRHRKYKYGLSHIDFERLLEEQGGVCAICHPCNLGLGAFKDSPEMLQIALRYLAG